MLELDSSPVARRTVGEIQRSSQAAKYIPQFPVHDQGDMGVESHPALPRPALPLKQEGDGPIFQVSWVPSAKLVIPPRFVWTWAAQGAALKLATSLI